MFYFTEFGLIDLKTREKLHLQNVDVSCNIVHLNSLVETTFVYKNQLSESADAKFVFPLNDVAVFRFTAKIDDRVIVAQCRPKEEAQTVFNEAVAEGHTAFITHQDEDCPDIFQMVIGNLPPGVLVTINLAYVGHLEAENVRNESVTGSKVVFRLPSVMCPRYSPADRDIEREFDPLEPCCTWSAFEYKISFNAELSMPCAIDSVTSMKDSYSMSVDSANPGKAKVTLSSGFKPDHTLEMVIRLTKPLESFGVIESGNPKAGSLLSQHCIMAQFMPDFSDLAEEQDLRTELIFIVDRSGSMSGSRIKQASESLMLFLASLPPGCRFQIIGFGSTHDSLFSEPMDYNADSLAAAQGYQSKLRADMGGTEILSPLRAAFDTPLTGEGWYKEIILLTDGDVANATEVVGLIASNVHKARVFPIGIGAEASTYLIPAIARAGRGVHTFISDVAQLRTAVVKILAAALQPRATITQIEWNLAKQGADGTPTNVSVLSAPTLPPPIFAGTYTTLYAFFDADVTLAHAKVTVHLKILDRETSMTVCLDPTKMTLPCSDEAPIHRLAGKCLLNELVDRYKSLQMQSKDDKDTELNETRSRIEQISCLFNVISPYTSFVCVDPVKNEVLTRRHTPAYDEVDCFASPYVMDIPFERCGAPMMRQCFGGALFGAASPPCAALPPIACRASDSEAYSASDSDVMDSCRAPCEAYGASDSEAYGASDSVDVAKTEPSTVVRVAQMQHFSGHWSLTEQLANFLHMKLDELRSKKPTTWPSPLTAQVSEDVWATVVMLAYLEVKLPSIKDEWKLLAHKAKTWLRSEAKRVGSNDAKASDAVIANLLEQSKRLF